jgi:hypothetical protein
LLDGLSEQPAVHSASVGGLIPGVASDVAILLSTNFEVFPTAFNQDAPTTPPAERVKPLATSAAS